MVWPECLQRSGESHQILRKHANDASTGAINVRYKKYRGRHNKRKNQKEKPVRLMRTVPEQHVAADGNRTYETPR
jgi:hypothetical protein